MGQITDNAIAWVQVHAAGGWRRMVWLAVGYSGLLIGIAGLMVLLNGSQFGAIDAMPAMLLAFQAFVVGGMVVFRSSNAVLRETTSKLMESHRLMPIDPRLAVVGYALGAFASLAPFILVNLALGAVATAQAGIPLSWWFWANGVLLSYGLFAACVAAGGAMLGSAIGTAVFLVLFAGSVTAGAVTLIVPGAAAMFSPIVDRTIFRTQDVDSPEVLRWVLCMVVQVPVAWMMVLAGARRFRDGDIPGITGAIGSALLLLFALASILVMLDPEMLPRHVRRDEITAPQYVGTLIAIMVLGVFVAVSHVARHAVELGGKCRGGRLLLRDEGVVAAVLIAALAFLSAVPKLPEDWQPRAAWTAIVLCLVIVTTLLWARWSVRRDMPAGQVVVALGFWWVLPMLAGSLVGGTLGWENGIADTLLQISPLAMLPAIWHEDGNTLRHGSLLLQCAMPVAGALALWRSAPEPAGA